jgi:Leucine-rich repeat (LRR) protein
MNWYINNLFIFIMDYDSILYIFTFLDIGSVMNCSLVCKSFNIISKNEIIWKRLFTETYFCIIKHNKYLINYKNVYKLDKFLIKYINTNIDQVINLKALYLYSKQLQSIPTEIGQLTNLHSLHLENNHLQSIPTEIGQLINLKTLVLDNEQMIIINKQNNLPQQIKNSIYLFNKN